MPASSRHAGRTTPHQGNEMMHSKLTTAGLLTPDVLWPLSIRKAISALARLWRLAGAWRAETRQRYVMSMVDDRLLHDIGLEAASRRLEARKSAILRE